MSVVMRAVEDTGTLSRWQPTHDIEPAQVRVVLDRREGILVSRDSSQDEMCMLLRRDLKNGRNLVSMLRDETRGLMRD